MYARLADEDRIQKIDEVISSYSGDPIVELALHDKFTYYFNEERDWDKALAVSNELDKLFPGSEGALDVQRMLGNTKLAKSNQNSSDKLNLANENKPIDFQLFPNHPNPFNPSTQIKFSIPQNEFVILKVYDIIGREIVELVNEEKPAGTYSISFEASNLSSGIYFYSISAGKYNQVNKMILLR